MHKTITHTQESRKLFFKTTKSSHRKCLLCMNEDLCLGPQHPHQKQNGAAGFGGGMAEIGIAGDHWLPRPPKFMCFWFSEKHCLKNIR